MISIWESNMNIYFSQQIEDKTKKSVGGHSFFDLRWGRFWIYVLIKTSQKIIFKK